MYAMEGIDDEDEAEIHDGYASCKPCAYNSLESDDEDSKNYSKYKKEGSKKSQQSRFFLDFAKKRRDSTDGKKLHTSSYEKPKIHFSSNSNPTESKRELLSSSLDSVFLSSFHVNRQSRIGLISDRLKEEKRMCDFSLSLFLYKLQEADKVHEQNFDPDFLEVLKKLCSYAQTIISSEIEDLGNGKVKEIVADLQRLQKNWKPQWPWRTFATTKFLIIVSHLSRLLDLYVSLFSSVVLVNWKLFSGL
eukprot:TRINITY_DN6305_c0_g1_i1.p1 TRINITY_DN6305_c0_g1~~TRINITY_DN6305_c0_g1_i1.p1  ORF type:complete len:257 (+),score=33.77 TRINITY_DN6305_c0_g1_i1:31-771(+)